MGIYTLLIALLCVSTGTFAVGVVTGGKLGSCYKKDVALKTSFVFTIVHILAFSLAYILGKLLLMWVTPANDWIIFSFLFSIAIQFMLESVEKSPSLNFTDIVQNTYLIKVAMQVAMPTFFLGFILAISTISNLLLLALFVSGLLTFVSVALGIVHGNTFNKTVLHSRLLLVAGIIILILAIRFLIVINA